MRTSRTRYQQGSIREIKLANGFAWEWRYRETVNGKRQLKAIRFSGDEYPTKAAVLKAIEHKRSLINTETGRGKVTAIFDVITNLYRKQHLPELRHSTQRTNAYLLTNYIEPKWHRTRITEITPLAIQKWIGTLDLGPTTKASVRSIMSQCFELAALHGFIPAMERNPVSLVRIRGTGKRQKPVVTITPAEFKLLVGRLPEPLNIMALVTGCLGLRISETLALQWTDIDQQAGTVRIVRSFTSGRVGKTKTGSSEALLPIDASLLAVLNAYRPHTEDSEWLFPSPRTGKPRSASMLLQKGLKPVAKELGLGNIGFHTLRHSYRTWLDSKGVPVGMQKDLLRHSDISTTMNVYGRAIPADMRAAQQSVIPELIPDTLAL